MKLETLLALVDCADDCSCDRRDLARRLEWAVEALKKASAFRDDWHWDVCKTLSEIEEPSQ